MSHAHEDPYADPDTPALPQVEMTLNLDRAALVVIDPQIDFLSPKGVTWDAFGASITKALLYGRPRCNGR